jgi:hypothetical protein
LGEERKRKWNERKKKREGKMEEELSLDLCLVVTVGRCSFLNGECNL